MTDAPTREAINRRLVTLVLLLIVVNLLFVLADWQFRGALRDTDFFGVPAWRLFNLSGVWSLPSLFGYLQLALGGYFLTRAAIGEDRSWTAPLAAIFFVLLLDDAGEVHESLGRFFVGSLDLSDTEALRAQDFGELMAMSGLAVIVFTLLLRSFLKAPSGRRKWPVVFLFLICGLATSGVLLDMVHIMADRVDFGADYISSYRIGVLENGGELVWMSLMLVMAIRVANLGDTVR